MFHEIEKTSSLFTAAGCYFNETIYPEEEKWVEPQVNPNDTSIDGRLMQCFRPHYSYYESHVVGWSL